MSEHHHIVTLILHFLAAGGFGLTVAATAGHFGWRAADRMPGESRMPHCVYCLRAFEWHETFPLFGWLMRKDALRLPCPCSARTGLWPQPVIELTGGALGCAALALSGWNWATVPLIFGLSLLPAIALIDLFFGIIPDGLNFLVAASGLAWIWISGRDFFAGLMTLAALLVLGLFLALVYSRWRGREMLGLGDVKFLAAAGLWLTPIISPWFLVAAGGVGLLFDLGWRFTGGGRQFPFAPALSIALAACVFYRLVQMP